MYSNFGNRQRYIDIELGKLFWELLMANWALVLEQSLRYFWFCLRQYVCLLSCKYWGIDFSSSLTGFRYWLNFSSKFSEIWSTFIRISINSFNVWEISSKLSKTIERRSPFSVYNCLKISFCISKQISIFQLILSFLQKHK